MNFEKHGEVTTFEILRMIEHLGSDVIGITLDIGNLPVTMEGLVCALRRVALYVYRARTKMESFTLKSTAWRGRHGLAVTESLTGIP